jgi:ankyrin repeat protein
MQVGCTGLTLRITTNLAGLVIGGFLVGSGIAAAEDLRLLDAVKRQDKATVRTLVRQHVDVNTVQPDGATALHWAVHWEDLETTDLLIRAGAGVNTANDLGVTPLTMAAASGNAAIIERLLAAGADAKGALLSGETALMLAVRSGSLVGAKALIAGGANVNAAEHTRGQTALMWAVANRHPEITAILLEHGADVRARSQTRKAVYNVGGNRSAGNASPDTPLAEIPLGGSTPILFAARSNDLESAKRLVAAGADVNDVEADGNTALVIAAHSGNASVATFLLEQKANPNAAPLGYTALHAAVLRGNLSDRDVRNTDPAAGLALVKALLAHGANPNARVAKGTRLRRWSHDFALLERWAGATPFWLAARFLELDMMRALAAAGGDTTLASNDGTTPLMAAAGTGYSRASGTAAFIKSRRDFSYYNADPTDNAIRIPDEEERLAGEAVKLAISLGGDVKVPNNAGDSALHAASALGMNTVIQLLVDNGADPNLKNKAGRTPLAVARRSTGVGETVVNERTAALLRKLGAQ